MSRPLVSYPGYCGLWGLMLVAIVGCGGGTSDPLNRQDVAGQVTFGGSPLDTGSISFEPQDASVSTSGGAVIENGKFALPKGRGLAPGTYAVRITSAEQGAGEVEEAPGDSSVVSKERIPANWNTQSDQTVTVEAGGENSFDFSIP